MTDFLTGLIEGFAEQRQISGVQQQNAELKNLQKKKLLADLDLAQKQAEAKGQLFDLTQQLPVAPGMEGPPQPTQRSISDVLATPEGQRHALEAGMLDIQGLQDIQQKAQQASLLEQLTQNQMGDLGGFVDPVSLLTASGTGDLGNLKSAEPMLREITNPDGSKQFVRVGKFGGAPVPVGQSAPSPMDMVITDPSKAEKFSFNTPGQTALGSTPRAAIEAGAQTKQGLVSPDQAGKLAALSGSLGLVQDLRQEIFTDDGVPKLNQVDFMNMSMKTPGTRGRELRFKFEDAIDSVIRARTGAAATETEMKSLIGQFMPDVFDRDEGRLDKMDRLESFLQGSLDVVDLPDSLKIKLLQNRTPQPPSDEIEMLKKNPSAKMKRFFDEVYGDGAADRILGQ